MNEFQIVCDRRTLSTDIQYMCEHGFDIKDCRIGHKKAYYIESQDEKLSVSDMKIIPEALDQRYKEWIRKSIGEENDENN